jgi:hypothetical protein
LLEDEVQGQQELPEAGAALGGVEEGDEGSGGFGALLPLPPVVEGGVGDACLPGLVAAGQGSAVRVAAVVADADGFAARVAERLFRCGPGWVSLAGRHGSAPGVGVWQHHGREPSRVGSRGNRPKGVRYKQKASLKTWAGGMVQIRDQGLRPFEATTTKRMQKGVVDWRRIR